MNRIRKALRAVERRIVAVYDFWQNYWHYLGLGYPPNKAWELARNTL
jgi:hypothetical protein